jgi:AcrR family transcriptional regulator
VTDEKRPYRMKRRAELEQATRRRITASTVELHEAVGPARTTISAIAERAGVRRSTVYRHFPDEAALFAACSLHWRAANPAPALEAWAAIADPDERLTVALGEMYAYHRSTEAMRTSLLRDEALVPIVGRLMRAYHDYLDEAAELLMRGRRRRGAAARRTRAAIAHALSFATWRSLAREQGLDDADVVRVMSALVRAAG